MDTIQTKTYATAQVGRHALSVAFLPYTGFVLEVTEDGQQRVYRTFVTMEAALWSLGEAIVVLAEAMVSDRN